MGNISLALTADASRSMRIGRRGEASLSLGAEGIRDLGRAVSGEAALALVADGLRNLGMARVGLAVLGLRADALRTMAMQRNGSAVLALATDSDPAGMSIPGHSPGCTASTLTPHNLHVVLGTATNGTCSDCANFAGVWPLTWVSGCNWSGPGPVICGVARTINFGHAGGNVWNLGFQGIAGFYTKALGSVWNGRTPILLLASGFGGGFCGFPGTVTVAPNSR